MPNGLMMADANFPRFTGGESAEKKIEAIQSYLFMLTEELRWAHANIGKGNFNETDFKSISEEIQGPVVKKYESLDLTVTDGDEGSNSATIKITGDGLQTEAKTITFKGMVTFKSLEDKNDTTIINGAYIKTGEIEAMTMRGNTLEGNVIEGNEITGGTITGTNIYGANFHCIMDSNNKRTGEVRLCYPNKSTVVGGLQIDNDGKGDETESEERIYLYALGDFALKLYGRTRVSLEADDFLYINSPEITIGTLSYITIGGDYSVVNINGTVKINGTVIS